MKGGEAECYSIPRNVTGHKIISIREFFLALAICHLIVERALRNSDVLTAVSHVASNVARFPIVILDDDKNAVKNIKSVDYLLNKHPNDMLSAYHWRF